VIILQRNDVAGQVLGADLVDGFLIAEELHEALEHSFILAMGIRFFERLDLPKVFVYGDVQRRRFRGLTRQFESRNSEFASFQFMPLAALCFERLCRRDACRLPTPFAGGAPLDEVETLGQGIPVVVAFGVAGNGKQLPIAVNFDLLDDVDVRHGFHLVGLSMSGH
jgi:hypothetical protein